MLRAVGLIGEGDTGERTLMGDLRDRDGLGAALVEMLRESLGFMLRLASILAIRLIYPGYETEMTWKDKSRA